MILGQNRLHMRALEAFRPGNCRKSRPGLNGTSPEAQNPKIRKKKKIYILKSSWGVMRGGPWIRRWMEPWVRPHSAGVQTLGKGGLSFKFGLGTGF